MTESEFIAALRALPLHSGARGLNDDCAVIEIGGETLIFNHDIMAEGTHFRPEADLADVAWKLVAINLSDLASKGAEPVGVLLGHSLGGNDQRFIDGLRDVLTTCGVPLMGGDTIAATGSSTYSLTAIGRATSTPVPSRTGAQPGDSLFITGALGEAMLGFEGVDQHLDSFNRPKPRLSEGRALAPLVSAMMDVSDGLLLDAFRMAQASNVSIALETNAIPVADPERRDECMRWGDDYELLFTLPHDVKPPVPAARIGTVEQRGFAPIFVDSEPVMNSEGLGYQHG
ncbi:thiamine-phosphate kinase [Erythrobacter sp. F6033]|uniref:thiamine-phosphate kinase n=1 Tax=Erythrobacter sp. F6033 TaxID=2926401 RepID=UPI001FF31A2C|nr:thiamine-phosphate kinase [Erythrobacter sp. F6033]MCK0128846.1 thiamine-phosphate kinase [Erythrobacter sp. F6033]